MSEVNVQIQQPQTSITITEPDVTIHIAEESMEVVLSEGQPVNIQIQQPTIEVNMGCCSGGGGGGATDWGDIGGTLSDQTDLQTALDGKVDENAAIVAATKTKITYDTKGLVTAGADAAIADITGLQTALDGKAAAAHTHPLSDLTQSGATTGQVPKWNGAAWVPDDEAGGADGNGIYTGSDTIPGGTVATLDADGSFAFAFDGGISALEISDIGGSTKMQNKTGAASVEVRSDGAIIIGDPFASIETDGSTGTAGQVATAIGDGTFTWQDAAGGSVSIIDITYADMETALAGATLTPGQFYRITDATGTDLGFVCQAVRDNEITVSGTGGYLNADFQAVGDYSGTPETFGTHHGIWSKAIVRIPYANIVPTNAFLTYSTSSGVFDDGETFTTDLGTTGEIIHDDGAGTVTIQNLSAPELYPFEIITGDNSGETATISTFTAQIIHFSVEETITGATSGATAVVMANNKINQLTAYMTSLGVDFSTSEVLNADSGLTADLDTDQIGPNVSLSEYVNGNIVLWNNQQWQVTDESAIDGTDPETNTGAYTLLDKATYPETYITAWDVSEYDFANDSIVYRQDLRGNLVRGATAIQGFQFGRDDAAGNSINSPETFDVRNLISAFNNNTASAGADVSLLETGTGTVIENNTVKNGGGLTGIIAGNDCAISANEIGQSAFLGDGICIGNECEIIGGQFFAESSIYEIYTGDNCYFQRNTLFPGAGIGGEMVLVGPNCEIKNTIIRADISMSRKIFQENSVFSNCIIGAQSLQVLETIPSDGGYDTLRTETGFSNFVNEIDITGITTLDFTAAFSEYIGIYNLTSGNATETISADSLANFPTLFPFRLVPAAGLVLTLTCTAAASATNGSIIGSTATIVLDGDNGDFVELEADATGTFVRVKNLQVYA